MLFLKLFLRKFPHRNPWHFSTGLRIIFTCWLHPQVATTALVSESDMYSLLAYQNTFYFTAKFGLSQVFLLTSQQTGKCRCHTLVTYMHRTRETGQGRQTSPPKNTTVRISGLCSWLSKTLRSHRKVHIAQRCSRSPV